MVLPVPWAVFEMGTRLFVGGVLIAWGVAMLHSTATRREVWFAAYQLIPARLVRPVALLIPPVTLLAGILLLSGAFAIIATITAGTVLTAVVVAPVVAHGRGLTLTGGGLYRLRPLLSRYAVLRNALFLVAVVLVGFRGTAAPALAARDVWLQTATVTAISVAAIAITLIHRVRRQRPRLAAATA
ncbi:MauE/DoxX family redox-associated membrane protein [Nocardia sp. NPDC024068]|uniref:MauE/DoxX family redox-associated membrane protein n=1 Tax=Nocardia sp. NPDC024068 TaxID=3157197 RepID=UPI0033F4F782